jgi:ribonuclease J
MGAARVVPIHSFAPQRFPEFFDRVELHEDGEWWLV